MVIAIGRQWQPINTRRDVLPAPLRNRHGAADAQRFTGREGSRDAGKNQTSRCGIGRKRAALHNHALDESGCAAREPGDGVSVHDSCGKAGSKRDLVAQGDRSPARGRGLVQIQERAAGIGTQHRGADEAEENLGAALAHDG